MKYQKEFIQCLFATFCVAIGICLYADCQLGADSLTVFLDGMNKTTHLSISFIDQLLIIIMLSMAYFINKQHIGISTIIHTITIGLFILLASQLISPLELTKQPFMIKLIGILFAELSFAFGFALMQKFTFGMATADAFIYGLVEKTHLSYIQIHFIFDIFFFTIGFLLGGTIGIGSILYVLTSGWLTYKIRIIINNYLQ